MSNRNSDLIDDLIGTTSGSRLDQVRNYRSVARDNIENAYQALFVSTDATHVSFAERHAIALFVTGLHQAPILTAHYAGRLTSFTDKFDLLHDAVTQEYQRGQTEGPYGDHASERHPAEDGNEQDHVVLNENRTILGLRLAAALEHAHLLTFHPRDASPDSLKRLLDAGWSVTGIVTISQLVSFLAFQVRVVSGLSQLAAKLSQNPAHRQLA